MGEEFVMLTTQKKIIHKIYRVHSQIINNNNNERPKLVKKKRAIDVNNRFIKKDPSGCKHMKNANFNNEIPF